MRRALLGTVVPALVAGLLLTASREAAAGPSIGADFNLGKPVGDTGGSLTTGIDGRLGYRIGLGPIFLEPEIGGGYLAFSGSGASQHLERVFAGGRFGLGGLVQPQIYGHGGYGWITSDLHGPEGDVGFALNFKLIPYFHFGAQVGYNVVSTDFGAAKWVNFGLNAGVTF